LVSFDLDDGEVLNREFPSTFWISPLDVRKSLTKGDIVKLIFRIRHDGRESVERMWVIVEAVEGTGYFGELDNDPVCTSELQSGAVIKFGPQHVIQIFEPS